MGRDFEFPATDTPLTSFYPRARMGRDPDGYSFNQYLTVSIRAPAWDATVLTATSALTITRFYPRARMGRDI